MAIPTNAQIEWRGTSKTLEASGGSTTSGSVTQADDANYDTVSDGEGAPDAEFVLAATFGTGPTEGTVIGLYARPLDIDSTNDAEVPEAARPTRFIGNFVVNNVTSAQYMILVGRDLPKLAAYYIHNNGTGQTISAGWTLKARRRRTRTHHVPAQQACRQGAVCQSPRSPHPPRARGSRTGGARPHRPSGGLRAGHRRGDGRGPPGSYLREAGHPLAGTAGGLGGRARAGNVTSPSSPPSQSSYIAPSATDFQGI